MSFLVQLTDDATRDLEEMRIGWDDPQYRAASDSLSGESSDIKR